MPASRKSLRICDKGHKYYKSSDCPVCPVCANENKPADKFLSGLSAPARRALTSAGITTVEDISRFSENEIMQLHGIGPSTIPKLAAALQVKGLSFKKRTT